MDFLECYICNGTIIDPKMCPKCMRLCCNKCMNDWIDKRKQQGLFWECGFCRQYVSTEMYLTIPWLPDIVSHIQHLQENKLDDGFDCIWAETEKRDKQLTEERKQVEELRSSLLSLHKKNENAVKRLKDQLNEDRQSLEQDLKKLQSDQEECQANREKIDKELKILDEEKNSFEDEKLRFEDRISIIMAKLELKERVLDESRATLEKQKTHLANSWKILVTKKSEEMVAATETILEELNIELEHLELKDEVPKKTEKIAAEPSDKELTDAVAEPTGTVSLFSDFPPIVLMPYIKGHGHGGSLTSIGLFQFQSSPPVSPASPRNGNFKE